MSIERVKRVLARFRGEVPPIEREKSWMGTVSGRRFYPLTPSAEDVDIRDIVRGLSMSCRYGGQVRAFYSVAEHSVHVSERVSPEYALEALLHDAAEAYIGDMVRPLKHQPEMAAFRRAEAAIEAAIFEAFNVFPTPESRADVKEIDDRIIVDEVKHLVGNPEMYLQTGALMGLKPLNVQLQYWSPVDAEKAFMERFAELTR